MDDAGLASPWPAGETSRLDLAFFTGGQSRFLTMAPPQPIIEAEVEHALHRLTGRPPEPKPIEVFGVGMTHATWQNEIQRSGRAERYGVCVHCRTEELEETLAASHTAESVEDEQSE